MIHHYNRLKSTCIIEITTQKNENYLSEGRNSLAFLPAHLISTKKFLCEFTEKCFVVIAVKSDHLMWYLLLQFFLEFSSIIPFMWYDFKILVKSKGRGTSLCLSSSVNWHKYFFFQLKAKYPIFHFLGLDGTILNLI